MRVSFIPATIKAPAIACASILLLLSTTAAHAQVTPHSGVSVETNGPFADAVERRLRETNLRSLKLEPHQGQGRPSVPRAVLDQIANDFKKIQLIRLGIVEFIKRNKQFEYKRLETDAAEIRKRAVRLRSYLAPSNDSDMGTTSNRSLDAEQLKTSTFDLCLEISRFVENPVFRPNAGVYRAQDWVDASKTLDTVISLSGDVESGARSLRKQK